MFSRVFPTMHRDFEDNMFLPFSHYVERAKSQRAARKHAETLARRRTDFTDAVLVTDVSSDVPPEFADTIPMTPDNCDVTTIDPDVIDVEILDREGAALLRRAQSYVAAAAFVHCLQQGYFPPRCQRCSR